MQTITYQDFEKIELRVGKISAVEDLTHTYAPYRYLQTLWQTIHSHRS